MLVQLATTHAISLTHFLMAKPHALSSSSSLPLVPSFPKYPSNRLDLENEIYIYIHIAGSIIVPFCMDGN